MQPIPITGCVILKDNAILLMHRIKTDWYELPGGKLEPGESHEQAAIRELKEELNVTVEVIKQLGSVTFKYEHKIYDYLWQLAKAVDTENLKIMETDKFSEYRFIALKDLKNYRLSTNMLQFMEKNNLADLLI